MEHASRRNRLAEQAKRRAPRVAIEEWHSISVVLYENGESKAWHNRIDLGTRRLVSRQLSDPAMPAAELPWHVLALTNAAEEVELDHRMQQGLW